jgi:hypothetical protein
MQECFEKRDIPMLQQLLMKMNVEEAKHHMKRCVDSGLWVPGPNDVLNPNRPQTKESDDEEETYDEPNAGPPHAALESSTTAKAITTTSSSPATDSSSTSDTAAPTESAAK